jgi:aminoglycoside phosphotransferase (APT) family kinase protein
VITLEQLNERHGTAFREAGAYTGGEVGALRLVDRLGGRSVLKRQPPGLAPQTTDVLRRVGYPAPRYVAWGERYAVQEELPGEPASADWGVAAPSIMSRLLELNELQAGCVVDGDTTWPQTIVESVTDGFEEFCVVETLERHSDESRELLALCRRAVERGADALAGARDITHLDYTLANVLVADEHVSGVIDWGGTRTGDRLFDLATLVYYAKGEAPELERYVVERIGEGGLAVYLAHMCVRQSDWSLRNHGLAAGEWAVSYSLELARGSRLDKRTCVRVEHVFAWSRVFPSRRLSCGRRCARGRGSRSDLRRLRRSTERSRCSGRLRRRRRQRASSRGCALAKRSQCARP